MARILLIDDDDLVRTTLSLLLQRKGHEVLEAGGGVEALSIFHSETPDLVITDIVMPGMDGLEVIQRLRDSAPGLKIIVVSGGGRDTAQNVLQAARELGADRVMSKPVIQAEFLAALSDLLKPD